MTIKEEIIKKLRDSYTNPFVIYDKINGSPFNKGVENILFSEDPDKFSFLGNVLIDSQIEKEQEQAYFFRDDPNELRNFENEIYTLRSWLFPITTLNLENLFLKDEEILKIWKFESPDFIIETNFRIFGVEVISLFPDFIWEDYDERVNNPKKSFENYVKIQEGKNEAEHSIYERIGNKEIENVAKHIKKAPTYNQNLKQLTFLTKNIEIFIIINFGWVARMDVNEKESLTNIISMANIEKFSLDNIYIMIGATKMGDKSKRNWICLKHYENFNNWLI